MTAAAFKDPGSLRTLKLNADGRPLGTWPLSVVPALDAVKTLLRERAVVVDTWAEAFLHSPSVTLAVPKVIMLRQYAPVNGEPKFCRASVYLRDRYCCQYCGKRFAEAELTLDHVRPRADGGETVWDNVLTCCTDCNALKADKPARKSGRKGVRGSLRPLKEPRRPTHAELLRAGLELLPNEIKLDFGSWLYQSVELQR